MRLSFSPCGLASAHISVEAPRRGASPLHEVVEHLLANAGVAFARANAGGAARRCDLVELAKT